MCSIYLGIYLQTESTKPRIKEYESKITDLESETDRLSQALDAQKKATGEAQAAAAKKVDELGREVQKKAAEVDQLKSKLRQYTDYDEIKRELEIMKARPFWVPCGTLLDQWLTTRALSTWNLPVWKAMRTPRTMLH